jgi:DNA polymerase III delta prime subunit
MTTLIISNNEEQIREEIHQIIRDTIDYPVTTRLEEITHPDIHFLNALEVDSLGIAETKSFTRILKKKPFRAAVHLGIIIGFEKATPEAQNALLKELEDHPPTVAYILGVIDESAILPTIRSRATVRYLKSSLQSKEHKEVVSFVDFFIGQEDILLGFAAIQKKEWNRLSAEALLTEIYQRLDKIRENKSRLALLQKCGEYLRNNVSPKQVLSFLLFGFRHKV